MTENNEITMKEADNTIDTPKIDLSLRQELFCQAYCDVGNETFGNGTKSVLYAKYSPKGASASAYHLLRTPKVKARLNQIQGEIISKHGISVESILAGIVHDQKMARQAGQFAVSNQCSKMLGDVRAMFSERLIIQAQSHVDVDVKPKSPKEIHAIREAAAVYNRIMASGEVTRDIIEARNELRPPERRV